MRTKISIICMSFIIALSFVGCASAKKEVSNASSKETIFYTFTDDLQNKVTLKEKPQRVVSLLGSYAETWELAGGTLVGVTDDVVSERKLPVSENTKIIGTVKAPNVEEILSLSPDFVLLSPDIEIHVKIADTLKKSNIPFAFFKVEYFDDYLKMLKICTTLTKQPELYQKNGVAVKEKIDAILSKISTKKEKPSILLVRALSEKAKALPSDNLTSKIAEDLNTENIATKHESLFDDLSMEAILKEDPDFIFVVPMGDTQKAIDALKKGIETNNAWKSLTAVQNERYIVLPKELFHYKPNARWGESYEYLAKILYPDLFQ